MMLQPHNFIAFPMRSQEISWSRNKVLAIC